MRGALSQAVPSPAAENRPAGGRPRSRIRRALVVLSRALFLVWLGMVAVLYAFQTRLIFPGAASQGSRDAQIIAPPGTELLSLTTREGDRVTALFAPALSPDGTPPPDPTSRLTLLYFYGNGTWLRRVVDDDIDAFRRLGVNVMAVEYLGYGLSGGQPGEAGCYASADAAYEELTTRRGVDPKRIVAVGRSLGGAVAIDLAARRPVGGVAAFCTFTTMAEMAGRRYPFIPTSLLLRHRFESRSKIGKIRCPILLGHGDVDQLVPPRMSEELALAATAPVTRFVVRGADHNDFYDIGGKQIFRELKAFLDRLP